MRHPSKKDPRKSRVFAVVGRQSIIDSSYSTVVCAPVFTSRHGLSTQVDVGLDEGLKHDSAIHCDGLMSIEKSALTDWVGTLGPALIEQLDIALAIALDLER